MTEKCFCHLNGYKVKDADARAQLSAHDVAIKGLSEGITELSEKVENAGGGKAIYKHYITIENDGNDPYLKFYFTIYNSNATPITTLQDFLVNFKDGETISVPVSIDVNNYPAAVLSVAISLMNEEFCVSGVTIDSDSYTAYLHDAFVYPFDNILSIKDIVTEI